MLIVPQFYASYDNFFLFFKTKLYRIMPDDKSNKDFKQIFLIIHLSSVFNYSAKELNSISFVILNENHFM